MWFTSTGAAKGIGHVTATGQGALTQVGGYEPESLTFGPDGAVWFTDETNNVVVRVPTSDLQATNVDAGAGSVLTGTPTPTTSGGDPATVLQAGKKPIAVKEGKVSVTLACTATGVPCTGKLKLTSASRVAKPATGKKGKGKKPAKKYVSLSKATSFAIAPGTARKVTVKLTGSGTRRLTIGKPTKVRVALGDATLGKITIRR